MDYELFIQVFVLIKYNHSAISHYSDKEMSHGGRNGYKCDALRYLTFVVIMFVASYW